MVKVWWVRMRLSGLEDIFRKMAIKIRIYWIKIALKIKMMDRPHQIRAKNNQFFWDLKSRNREVFIKTPPTINYNKMATRALKTTKKMMVTAAKIAEKRSALKSGENHQRKVIKCFCLVMLGWIWISWRQFIKLKMTCHTNFTLIFMLNNRMN